MDPNPAPYRRVIMVCTNERTTGEPACGNRCSGPILERLKIHVKEHGLRRHIRVCKTGCLDQCALGPNVVIMPDNVWLKAVSDADVDRIIADWVTPIEREVHDRGCASVAPSHVQPLDNPGNPSNPHNP